MFVFKELGTDRIIRANDIPYFILHKYYLTSGMNGAYIIKFENINIIASMLEDILKVTNNQSLSEFYLQENSHLIKLVPQKTIPEIYIDYCSNKDLL